MTLLYPQVLAALKSDSAAQMRRLFEGMSQAEQAEAGTFIGPRRLASVTAQDTPAGVPQATQEVTDNLAELGRQAFGTAPPRSRDGQPVFADEARSRTIGAALLAVEHRRAGAPLLTMSEDVTRTLPPPNGVPAPLSDADYATAAKRNNVEVAAIKAVAQVESGGRRGFDAQGRPKVLFEAHHFGPLTQGRFNKTHPHLACGARETAKSRRYYPWDQYERLREALVLDVDAALKAASWGKFQVLGSNHDGWPDVRSFVAAMFVSEATISRPSKPSAASAICSKRRAARTGRASRWATTARDRPATPTTSPPPTTARAAADRVHALRWGTGSRRRLAEAPSVPVDTLAGTAGMIGPAISPENTQPNDGRLDDPTNSSVARDIRSMVGTTYRHAVLAINSTDASKGA